MIDSDIIRSLIICLALVGSFYCGMRFERDRLLHELKEEMLKVQSFYRTLESASRKRPNLIVVDSARAEDDWKPN
jgi:hypothetical protein